MIWNHPCSGGSDWNIEEDPQGRGEAYLRLVKFDQQVPVVGTITVHQEHWSKLFLLKLKGIRFSSLRKPLAQYAFLLPSMLDFLVVVQYV